jgi:hypothetical protein
MHRDGDGLIHAGPRVTLWFLHSFGSYRGSSKAGIPAAAAMSG